RRNWPVDPMPAYRQLFDIGCAESSYPVKLAVAQEIGAGGDDALAQLAALLGPDPANGDPVQAEAHDQVRALASDQGDVEADGAGGGLGGENDIEEHAVMRAWLVPLLVGSATSEQWIATAGGLLQCWLDSLRTWQHRAAPGRFGLSLEIALAQGFK